MYRCASRVLALTVAAWLGATAANAQQFTMKLSSPVVNDSTQEYMKALKAGVEERSKGRIKVEMYPANQLGQIPATVDGVALGTIEMTMPAIGFFIGIEPRFQTLEAAGLFDSMAHGLKVLGDPEIRARLATFGEAKGVEPLFTILHGELLLITNKPVRTLAETSTSGSDKTVVARSSCSVGSRTSFQRPGITCSENANSAASFAALSSTIVARPNITTER